MKSRVFRARRTLVFNIENGHVVPDPVVPSDALAGMAALMDAAQARRADA